MKRCNIMQLDYDTGELIEIYPAIKDAANDNYLSYISLMERLRRGGGSAVYNDKQLNLLGHIRQKQASRFRAF